MDKYPKTFEEYNAMDSHQNMSEIEFYKHSYALLYNALEDKNQEAYGYKVQNEILRSDLIEVSDLNEKLKEEIGDSSLKLDDLKRKNAALENKYETILMENGHLKQKVMELKKNIEKIVTIKHVEELLDKKLARLENNIIGQLQPSNSIPKVTTKSTNCNKDTPTSSNEDKQTNFQQPVTNQTFNAECIELLKQCTEWWCPMHSEFKSIVKLVKPTSEEDESIIKKAKSRFAYWSKGGIIRCCTIDRKRLVENASYNMPSCWPSSMPVDMDKLTTNFNKL